MKNDSAFPTTIRDIFKGPGAYMPEPDRIDGGLTKREYFIAKVMQGILAGRSTTWDANDLANRAIQYADTLIAVLEKK